MNITCLVYRAHIHIANCATSLENANIFAASEYEFNFDVSHFSTEWIIKFDISLLASKKYGNRCNADNTHFMNISIEIDVGELLYIFFFS